MGWGASTKIRKRYEQQYASKCLKLLMVIPTRLLDVIWSIFQFT
jgi:hypothetical protein